MNAAEKKERAEISVGPQVNSEYKKKPERHYLIPVFVSGLLSVFLVLIIIHSLSETTYTLPSLLEYSVSAALLLFLSILLIRYLVILLMAYLNLNRYTFETDNDFRPFVSVIVPAYNEEKLLKYTINSLLELDYKDFEIIVVNDGSTDTTREIAESYAGYRKGKYSDIKISVINKENSGKASALNAGIKYSEAEFILCIDSDSQTAKDSLKRGIRHFINPSVGAVAGNVKVLNRGKFLTDLQALEYMEGLNLARSAQSYIKLVNIVPGPLGIFRRSAIAQAGFYSGDTFAEDADLTLQLISRGWNVFYEPGAVSYTESPEKILQLLKQRYRWSRGIIQAIKKNRVSTGIFSLRKTVVFSIMSYEALLWPVMNVAAHFIFIAAAFFFGFVSLIFFWWAALTLLDLIAALYCIASEKEEIRLVFYSVAYRVFFSLIVDVCRTFSAVEEFLEIKMSWGKLERTGYI